ncbi:MAG TPA: DUF6345 domain-containing protein [Verrucomicrobiae bacterium]|nr:DUF6345 domain-containing protein [Verrucomicrobiae bacterium]
MKKAILVLKGACVLALIATEAPDARAQSCLDLQCPRDIVAFLPCGAGCLTISNYPTIVATNYCNPTDLVVWYDPPPGSCFPLGTTPVVVTAAGSGLTNSCSFSVTVVANPNCPVSSLPVFSVVQSGALPAQAVALANSLNIPTNAFTLTDGQMDFINPTNFIAAPVAPVTDPTVQSNLLADTVNKYPGIPIRFEQPDLAALNALAVPGSNAVVASFATGLNNAGLMPPSATPIVTHTVLTAFYTNDSGAVLSGSNCLDTEVSYQMTLQGLPVVGPGAQVQAAYGPDGSVARLHYAARQLVAGPPVNIISPTTASNIAAATYGFNGPITMQLVYYAPPLSFTTVSNLIPWYLCGGTMMATNPESGQFSPIHLMRILVPATDDTNFVPAVQMTAITTGGGTQVVASASVTGGSPPYTYLWSGSQPDLFTDNVARIQYAPMIQVTPAKIFLSRSASAGAPVLSWVDPIGLYQMQSSSNLAAGSWAPFTNTVAQNNGIASVTVDTAAQAQFFRLVVPNQPVPAIETVGLWVLDHNGVYVGTHQNIGIQTLPILLIQGSGSAPTLNWGTEAPYDQDFMGWDAGSWRSTMQNFSATFGSEQFDRGEYIAHPLDFIHQPFGWDETVMDTADITFYCGHGNPNAISFTETYQGSGTPAIALWNTDQHLPQSWGDRLELGYSGGAEEEWMALLSCQVLAQADDPKPDFLAFQRWGPAFNGMHSMLGFETDAWSDSITGVGGDSFETVFIKGMAATKWPLTIQQAWFHAALTTGPLFQGGGVGEPACLGPIAGGGAWDEDDFWWGIGSVGPTIRANNIKGWFYLHQTQ